MSNSKYQSRLLNVFYILILSKQDLILVASTKKCAPSFDSEGLTRGVFTKGAHIKDPFWSFESFMNNVTLHGYAVFVPFLRPA